MFRVADSIYVEICILGDIVCIYWQMLLQATECKKLNDFLGLFYKQSKIRMNHIKDDFQQGIWGAPLLS